MSNLEASAMDRAIPVDDCTVITGLCRATLYKAISTDPTKRGNLPFLPSLKIGGSRRVRTSTLQSWLAQLEQRAA